MVLTALSNNNLWHLLRPPCFKRFEYTHECRPVYCYYDNFIGEGTEAQRGPGLPKVPGCQSWVAQPQAVWLQSVLGTYMLCQALGKRREGR